MFREENISGIVIFSLSVLKFHGYSLEIISMDCIS
jgi:hypothetical protein